MAQRQIVTVFFARAVGNNQRRARIRFRFLNRFYRLVQLRAKGNLRDVNVAVHHHADAEVFARLALTVFAKLGDRPQRGGFSCLAAGVGIALGIEHQNIDVFGQAQHVVKTAEADIVGPAIATD